MGDVSKRECLEAMKEAREINNEMGLGEFRKIRSEKGWPTDNTIAKKLGSWKKAKKMAGFISVEPFTDQDCIDAIAQAREEVDDKKELSCGVYDDYVSDKPELPSSTTIYTKLGGWKKAKELANIEDKNNERRYKWDDIIDDYENGMDLEEISQKYEVGKHYAKKKLGDFGVAGQVRVDRLCGDCVFEKEKCAKNVNKCIEEAFEAGYFKRG